MLRANGWRAGVLVVLMGLSLSDAPRTQEVTPHASERPRLVLLAPGTRVVGGLPGEWSDRVIRSVPRLASGEIVTLPGTAKHSAALFRTTILADVAGGPGGYRLRAVGVGNAVPFGGRELVVTPEGPGEVLATLSTVERIVAGMAYDEISRGRLVASTPTFALLRTPARLVLQGRHEAIDLYYGILVEPETGALRTLNWATLPGIPRPPRHISLLPADLAFDCGLDVAVSRKIGPLNISWSFAMASLPPGQPVDLTPDAARLVESTADGTGDPVALEEALRGLIADAISR